MEFDLDKIQEEVDAIDLQNLDEQGIRRTHESFYILGNYPPLLAMDEVSDTQLVDAMRQQLADIYMHIPFCNQHCNFCHFRMDQNVEGAEDERISQYLEYLKKEIDLIARKTKGLVARSLYIGGGTPSMLTPEQVSDIFDHLRKRIELPNGITISFDFHPEVIRSKSHEKLLQVLQENGVNRAVIGGVDLDDKVLQVQQRGHKSRHTIRLIQKLKQSGFDNIATDLLFGVQHQTPESWLRTLDVLSGEVCETDCIMTFPLMFKASQVNWIQYLRNSSKFPSMRDRMVMQLSTGDFLARRGYTQLPVYYYNRDIDKVNDQQVNKFRNIDETGLLPIGLSSFGHMNGFEFFNYSEYADYYGALDRGELPVWKGFRLNERQIAERRVMFGLKTGEVDLNILNGRFVYDFKSEYEEMIHELGNLGLLELRDGILRLTRIGMLFAEEICDKFASNDIREKADERAGNVHPRNPLQRYNYNMMGHRLKIQ